MQQVHDYIDEHWHEALDDLIQLCRQPSISANGKGMVKAARLVSQMMHKYGLVAKILPTPNDGYPIIYGEAIGKSPVTLLFYNHYDVQPPEPLDLWSTPPFEPTIYQETLRARGVSDNKGNIIARLLALKAWQVVHGKLPVSIKFLIEGEEEIGSPNIPTFVEQNRQMLKADACIWEGGGINWKGQPTIRLGLKGILSVELIAEGASTDVHSSMATVVPNPSWRLVWALASLKDMNENILIDGFHDKILPPNQLETEAAQNMPLDEEETKKSLGLKRFVKGVSGLDFKKRHIFGTTCNICGLESGYTGQGMKTVLPRLARAKLDFRLVPDQRPEEIMAKLRQHLDKHGFTDVFISPKTEGENPARTPLDSPFVGTVSEAAKEVYKIDPVLLPNMAGSGPMFSFTNTLGIPTICIGVEYPDSRDHAPNENIRIVDFITGTKHVAAILEKLASNKLS
ncbi:M20/M25/M40 family metallo-hydrolase [Chloroflexota bacterium]